MIALAIITVLLAFAAWRDFATRSIPDSVSIAIVVVGLSSRILGGWQPLAISLATAVLLFFLLLPLQARGLLGGADLKLLSALALGLPPAETYHLVLVVTLVGAALALLYVGLRHVVARSAVVVRPAGRERGTAPRVAAIETWRIRKGAPLPYAIAIATGAAVVVLSHQGV